MTIAAIATPPGIGALAVLRLSGPRAKETALAFLKPVGDLEPRRAVTARAFYRGEPLDRVVAIFYPGPRSATGEDLLEITAHGSPLIMERLLAAALEAGARAALPGEFTRRAFVNGRLDLAQAEAVCQLIRAKSDEARRAALRQLEGGLSEVLRRLRQPLFDLLVRVEAGLDHPEEDIPPLSPAEARAALAAARARILELAASHARGRLIAEGARVCLVGRPNAGKSSLMNALLGFERAIVCREPGTTRDVLEEPAVLGKLPSVLIDTAGLSAQNVDEADRLGQERTRKALNGADLAVLVVDGSRPLLAEDTKIHESIQAQAHDAGIPVLIVLNKADLGVESDLTNAITVSALKGTGIAALVESISTKLDNSGAETPMLVTALRHRDCLNNAAAELDCAMALCDAPPRDWQPLAAHHLRTALKRLGEITGEDAGESLLDAVFSRFCVGK